jgi:diguanylate cyclase (GGDEF)-like protein
MRSAESAHAQRYIALIDLDHFKAINDCNGHLVGDQVLVNVSQILLAWERSGFGRQVGRWGGEEFIATFECRSRVQAGSHVDRLRRLIGQTSVSSDDGHDVEVTASIGLAQVSPLERLEAALLRADKALYSAKAAGRNRCLLAA